MSNKNRENFTVQIMNEGFSRASNSFSKFLGKSVKITNSTAALLRQLDFSALSHEKDDVYVLITHIIGDLSGKSYLIFKEDESNHMSMIAGHVSSQSVTPQMKEGLLIEIDNIISASVIAELSNALQVEIYGDVPVIKKLKASELKDFINNDALSGDATNAVLTSTTFQFNVHEGIHPQFIWKLSSKVFDLIPTEKLVESK